jgi:Tfp pilus assembly protein PilX
MRHRRPNRAFALIVTVIILALLAVMAVAFLSTSRVERGTARGVADKVKADLTAQSAVNAAIARLIDNVGNYPDSATTWEAVNGTNAGTILYFRDKTPELAIPAGANTNTSKLKVLPLISGGIVTDADATSKKSSLPTLDNTNSYDLNHARFSGDTQGWIGAPPGSSRPEYRGQWIDIADSSSPSKITARYAYWMEDESFKVNTNLMGNTLRGPNTLGDAPTQIPLQGMLAMIGNDTSSATTIFDFRKKFPSSLFYEYRALNQANSGQPTLGDSAKFVATIYSGALNLSRSGSKRVNLNRVVADSTDAAAIRTQLDQIIKTITYHLPNFGQRFYRLGSDKNSLDVPNTGSPSHQTIYLNKIAANVRDYISTNSQPTIVNNDSTINIGSAPAHSLPGGGASGPNEVIAIGKKAVPFTQEYMVRVKQDIFTNRLGASATYKLEIDHYVEVWNMTNKDITVSSLGPNAFLRIANQFGWDANGAAGGTDIPEDPSRDFSVPLNSFTNSSNAALSFPAGTVTVLTTDPAPLPGSFPGVDPARVFRPPNGIPADPYRVYQGTTTKKSGSNLRINSIPRPVNSSTSADLETEVILGNDNGVLESFCSPAVYYITCNVDDGTSNADSVRSDTAQYYFRASSLKGNASSAIASQVGDPRTNNEQLSITTSVSDEDQTAYKLEAWNSPSQISNTTFTALNTNYVNPAIWTDPATNTTDAAHSPAAIANGTLASVGQIGDVFDPARSVGGAPGSGNIAYSRGGGRTFKIGQPDDLWDRNSNSASREWTAWRLSDVFTTADLIQLDGRVNINGVNRDGGTAVKAALYGYIFQPTPNSDSNLAGKPFDTDPPSSGDKVIELIKQMQARIKNDGSTYSSFASTSGPFAERGELSEMPMFNTGADLVTGVNTSNVYDRGREELFRRLVELITTRGNVFTVYAAGQSLVPQASGTPVVTATSQLKVTFRIDPIWTAGAPTDPFDPTSNVRFNKPDKYAIKILYAGD